MFYKRYIIKYIDPKPNSVTLNHTFECNFDNNFRFNLSLTKGVGVNPTLLFVILYIHSNIVFQFNDTIETINSHFVLNFLTVNSKRFVRVFKINHMSFF